MFYSNNSNGYYKRKDTAKKARVIISVLIIVILTAAIVTYCEVSKRRTNIGTSAVLSATPTAEPTTAVDLTEPTPVSGTVGENSPVPVSADFQEPAPTFEPDLLKKVRNKDGVKTAYLTFDDGPTNSVTPKILDTLRRYNIKATFFEVGSLIESNPDMARRVYEEGHLIANHSYAHNYSALYAQQENFISEVTKTEELIKNITCEENIFKLFRYPGGSYDAGTWGHKKQLYKQVLADMGYYYCDWNALNGDAEGGHKTAEQLTEGVKKTTEGKEDVVILMHDAAAKKETAAALEDIVKYLISQGYEFKRLDE